MIWHVSEQHATVEPRILRARENWRMLYKSGKITPAHVNHWDFSATLIGDSRNLPLLTEVLDNGIKHAGPSDIILLTNDDTLLHPLLPDMVLASVTYQGACSSFRLNSDRLVKEWNADLLKSQCKPDFGRDLFAFRKDWLVAHWHLIPRMFLGELEWDLILALIVRLSLGIETCVIADLGYQTPAELPLGYVVHERHAPRWQSISLEAPAKLWNRNQAKGWYAERELNHFYTLG